MAKFVEKQNYAAMVLVCKYKGATDINTPETSATAYESWFYEINRGLTAINTSYQINGQGSGSVTINLPIDSITEQSNKAIFDQVLNVYTAGQVKSSFFTLDQTTKSYINQDGSYKSGGKAIQNLNIQVEDVTVTNNLNKEVTFYPILDKTKTQCVFSPNDKIRIYLEGRFSTNLYKVFEGLIQSSSVNYDGMGITISIQFTDNTKWLDMSEYNINPAVAQSMIASRTGATDVTVFSTNLAGMYPQDVIRKMILGDTKPEKKLIDRTIYGRLYDDINTRSKLWAYIKVVDAAKVVDKDKSRWIQGESVAKTVNGKTTNGFIEKTEADISGKLPKGYTYTTEFYVDIIAIRGCGYFLLQKGYLKTENGKLTEIMQNTAFGEDSLWIDPNIFTVPSFVAQFGSFDLWNHQYVKRYQICKDVADRIEGEFFATPDGTLVFKMPYYNYNPGVVWKHYPMKDDGTLDKTKPQPFMPNGDFYLIEDKDIMGYNFSEDDSDIVNFIWVTGSPDYRPGINMVGVDRTYVFNENLIAKFGVRENTIVVPFAAEEKDEEKRQNFGQAYMNRRNARYKKGNMTIPLRPEIEIGKTMAMIPGVVSQAFGNNPVYKSYEQWSAPSIVGGSIFSNLVDSIVNSNDAIQIPVYYIQGLGHSWAIGSQPTSSLQLAYGRTWKDSFGASLFEPEPYVAEDAGILKDIMADINRVQTKIRMGFDKESELAASISAPSVVYKNIQIYVYANAILNSLRDLYIKYVNSFDDYKNIKSELMKKKFSFQREIVFEVDLSPYGSDFNWLRMKSQTPELLYPLQENISNALGRSKYIWRDITKPLQIIDMPVGIKA